MSSLGLPFCGLNGFWDFLKGISNLGLGPWMMRIYGVGRENDTMHIWKFAFFNPFQNWTTNFICIFYSKQACIIVVSSLGVLDPNEAWGSQNDLAGEEMMINWIQKIPKWLIF